LFQREIAVLVADVGFALGVDAVAEAVVETVDAVDGFAVAFAFDPGFAGFLEA